MNRVPMRRRRSFVPAALLLTAACASTRSPAGNAGARLAPGIDSLAIFYVQGGDTVRTGMLRDELTFVNEGGRQLLRRVYVSADRLLGTRLDTLVDVAATLAPVRHRSRTERSRELLDFGRDAVTGWLWLADGDSVGVRTTLPAGVINSSSFDTYLRAADLRDGWTAEVPAFLPNSRSVTTLRARVAGVDTVAGEASFRVAAEFAGMPVTFWIGQRSRRLRRQVMQIRPDAAILFQPVVPDRPAGRTG